MDKLVENILKNELVSATEIFEERMATIAEKKLYEAKRSIAANIDEALGGMSQSDIEAKKKAGYRKAADVLPDPRNVKIPFLKKVKDRKKAAEPSKDADLRKTFGVTKDKEKRPGVIQRNINTLMGREPGYKPEPKAPEQKGGRVGKAVRAGGKVAGGIIGTTARLVGDFAAGLEEESRSKRKIVLKKKKDPTSILNIKKDKYNRNTDNRKVED